MLDDLLKNYGNQNSSIGTDGRYHTVYYLELETGQFYIGKHTTDDISTDNYICSSKLVLFLINQGARYTRTVMFYFDTAQDALNRETEILSNKKYYNHPNNINCYPGSPPDATGTIIVSKNNKFKMIHPLRLEMFLSDGWEQKGIKRVWIHKDGQSKMVIPDDIPQWLSQNWILGNATSRGRIFIANDGQRKYINKNFLNDYLKEGWTVEHNIAGTKVIRKGKTIKKVRPHELDHHLKNGFLPSSTVEGLIYIKKGDEYKRVPYDKLDLYLSDGWEKGNNTSGKTYINNGTTEKRIHLCQLDSYSGWVVGRLEKVYLNNGVIEKRVIARDESQIAAYLQNGFVIGPLKRSKKICIYKGALRKSVAESQLQEWEGLGWTADYKKRNKA